MNVLTVQFSEASLSLILSQIQISTLKTTICVLPLICDTNFTHTFTAKMALLIGTIQSIK